MPIENILGSLSPEQLKQQVAALQPAIQLMAVTLISGDILMGGLMRNLMRDDVVSVRFNTPRGRRFGSSTIVEVPPDLIADVRPVPLDKDSTPKLSRDRTESDWLSELRLSAPTDLPVWDYPNPLATII